MPQFYYYHNPKRNPHIRIHLSTCGNCKAGEGKHEDVDKGKNSIWAGPFDSIEWAIEYITSNIKIDYPITFCKFCLPKINERKI